MDHLAATGRRPSASDVGHSRFHERLHAQQQLVGLGRGEAAHLADQTEESGTSDGGSERGLHDRLNAGQRFVRAARTAASMLTASSSAVCCRTALSRSSFDGNQ